MQRFLIIKLLIKRLILTNAGVAPSGTTGLRKPPGSLLPAFSLLAYHCGLLEYGTCLEKMPFSPIRLSMQPLTAKRLVQEHQQFRWFAF